MYKAALCNAKRLPLTRPGHKQKPAPMWTERSTDGGPNQLQHASVLASKRDGLPVETLLFCTRQATASADYMQLGARGWLNKILIYLSLLSVVSLVIDSTRSGAAVLPGLPLST